MTEPLKPCPKCGDGSSEYGCNFCIGETRADPALGDVELHTFSGLKRAWIAQGKTIADLQQQLASAQAEIERMKGENSALIRALHERDQHIEGVYQELHRERRYRGGI